jgi:hypothetical protein
MMSFIRQLPIVQTLLASPNPSIQYKTRANLLEKPPESPDMQALRQRIGDGRMARAMLSHLRPDGTIATNPYRKWQGPLWTLVSLALIDYPPGDASLHPMRDQAYGWLLAKEHLQFPRSLLIPGQEERFRRCACQEAYVAWATWVLGIADERTDLLVERLKQWQWPDGGWNCDKRPEARLSSFHESFMPLRVLALHAQRSGDATSRGAADRAAEIFLKRLLFRRVEDGSIIDKDFLRLTYPNFYHYNLLTILVILAEAGYLHDPRCQEALDILQSKQLPDGGFPLERRVFVTSAEIITRGTFADWGPAGKHVANEFVTVEALYVLKQAGRL